MRKVQQIHHPSRDKFFKHFATVERKTTRQLMEDQWNKKGCEMPCYKCRWDRLGNNLEIRRGGEFVQ